MERLTRIQNDAGQALNSAEGPYPGEPLCEGSFTSSYPDDCEHSEDSLRVEQVDSQAPLC